jgi:hypothetical protein
MQELTNLKKEVAAKILEVKDWTEENLRTNSHLVNANEHLHALRGLNMLLHFRFKPRWLKTRF